MPKIKLLSRIRRSVQPHFKTTALLWLYLLCFVPTLTDLAETGALPQSARGWITEVGGALVIFFLVKKVRQEHFKVVALTRLDALTGLWNRRAFDEAIVDECTRQQRSGLPLSLVFIDLDNFKGVNDSAGHDAGDRTLQQLAQAIRETIRAHVDRGFRLGGDEFALLLPNGSATQAQVLVERIRQSCLAHDPLWSAGSLGISAGIVEYRSPESVENLISRADAAMYVTKRARRSGMGDPAQLPV